MRDVDELLKIVVRGDDAKLTEEEMEAVEKELDASLERIELTEKFLEALERKIKNS